MSAISNPPCCLQALPSRTAGKCLWVRGLLPLLLCLGWLWGATPVAAQDQVPPPRAVETTGPYRNLAENHAGAFHLTREEGVVYATFQTDRSPVQFLARDQPEVLFTVPEGFRPVLPVTWEVSANPVLPDGTLHPDQPERRVFRMRVDTAGQVRYVDDAGVDGVGYLGYDTALAWPLAGTEPQVCARPRYIREAILAAVQALDDVRVPCSLVDWEHLAHIRTLSLYLAQLPVAHTDILAAHSVQQALLGLTNLAALQVSTPNPGLPPDLVGHTLPDPGLPAGFLAHTPRLERLEVDPTNFLVLPTGLFRYTPLLSHLSLGYARDNLAGGSISNVSLPADLLASVPHLESLAIANRLPAKELVPLLAHLPRLTHLDVGSYSALPETLLEGVPRLTHLELFSSDPLPETLLTPVPHLTHLLLYSPGDLPETFLEGVPRLTHLELRDIHDPDLPANLLSPVPQLESLHLESWRSPGYSGSASYSASAPGLVLRLSHVPRLTRLTVNSRTSLPETFLEGVAHLTHLTVTVREGLELPDALLAPVPRLTHLTVHGRDSLELPGDWLAPVPALEILHLEGQYPGAVLARLLSHKPRLTRLTVSAASPLPETFLPEMPRLTHLTLTVAGMDGASALPARLLARVPALTHLTLKGARLALPDGFFAQTPHLTFLALDVDGTNPLPARLLDPVPQLTELLINTGSATSLPPDFLAHAPHLKVLHLKFLEFFPAGFLTHAPRLETLVLSVDSLEAFPADILTHAPYLETLHLSSKSEQPPPEGFLSHAPRLVELDLYLPRLQALPPGFLAHAPRLVEFHMDMPWLRALPPGFLAHAPRLEKLELDYARYERSFPGGNILNLITIVTPLRRLPEGFLADAPRLRHLKLELGLVERFPEDFLAHAPQLRNLDLNAHQAASLPSDFLARHPGLETVRLLANGIANLPRGFLDRSPNLQSLQLDLQQVEALPEGFLTQAPHLEKLELGVNRVAALPPDFLAQAPHLTHLNLRALNLTALPPDFLAHAPHIHTLGLALPLLEPTLTPEHRLWDLLQSTSLRVKVVRPDPTLFLVADADALCEDMPLSSFDVAVGNILEVRDRTRDDRDRSLLRVNYWRDRELSVTFWGYACPYLIDARFTEPTLDVCAADSEPDACVPVRDHYLHPESFPFRG